MKESVNFSGRHWKVIVSGGPKRWKEVSERRLGQIGKWVGDRIVEKEKKKSF